MGCDYSLVDHHTFTVGKVIVNNTPDQTGELMEEQHKSLFIRPGSMVLKIYKHSVIRENRLDFPEHIFMRIIAQDLCGACISGILREWRSRFTIIISTRYPQCIILRKKMQGSHEGGGAFIRGM